MMTDLERELLEALRELLKHYNSVESAYLGKMGYPYIYGEAAKDRARAAIAKAEGKVTP